MSPLWCLFSLNSWSIMVARATGTGFPCVIVIPIQMQMSRRTISLPGIAQKLPSFF